MAAAPSWVMRWLRRVLIGLVVLVVLGILAKYWIIPIVAKWQIRVQLGKYWAGPIEVKEVDFNYLAPIEVGDLNLLDNDGRSWLHVGRVKVELGGWPGFSPYLKAVEVQTVEPTAHFVHGRCCPPLLSPPEEEEETEPLEFQSVLVKGITLTVVDEDTGDRIRRGPYHLAIQRMGEQLHVSVALDRKDSRKVEYVRGTLDPQTLAANLSIRLEEAFGGTDMAILMNAMDVEEVAEFDGELRIRMDLTGNLDEPSSLRPKGTINLVHWRMNARDGSVIGGADLGVSLDGQKGHLAGKITTPAGSIHIGRAPLQFDIAEHMIAVEIRDLSVYLSDEALSTFWEDIFSAVRLRGTLSLTGRVDIDFDEPTPVRPDLHVVKLDMTHILFPTQPRYNITHLTAEDVHLQPAKVSVVRLAGRLPDGNFQATAWAALAASGSDSGPPPRITDWARLGQVIGSADVFGDDVQVVIVPILQDILKAMGPTLGETAGVTDIAARISLKDGILTIREGQVANPLSALRVEEGGTVNLNDTQLDLHVVGVPVKALRAVLQNIPLLNLAVDFKDRIARVHVKGSWNDPPATLIRKDTVADVTGATADFFKGVVKTGGQLGAGLLDILKPPPTDETPPNP